MTDDAPSPEAVLREHYPELDDAQMDALLEDDRVCQLAKLYAKLRGWHEAGDALAKQVQTVLAEEVVQ